MQAPQPPAAQLCTAGGAAAGQEQAQQQQAHQQQNADLPLGECAQQQAREAAPGAAATAAAEGDPQRQPGAANQAAPDGPGPAEDAAAGGEGAAGEEGEEYDEELGAWLAGRLQRMQPGAELTVGSVKVLGKLLDEITVRVLEEAQRVSAGDTAASSSCPVADAGSAAPAVAGAAVAPESAAAAAVAGQAAGAAAAGERRGKQAQANKASALTSLDIHKALKRVLPGEPSDNKLRPYLPAVTKQAWHLDKQSLKGIKRQKQAAGAVAPAAGPVAAAAEPAVGGAADEKQAGQPAGGASGGAKENQQHQLAF